MRALSLVSAGGADSPAADPPNLRRFGSVSVSLLLAATARSGVFPQAAPSLLSSSGPVLLSFSLFFLSSFRRFLCSAHMFLSICFRDTTDCLFTILRWYSFRPIFNQSGSSVGESREVYGVAAPTPPGEMGKVLAQGPAGASAPPLPLPDDWGAASASSPVAHLCWSFRITEPVLVFEVFVFLCHVFSNFDL